MQYIHGQWREQGSHRFTSTNPATGELLWEGWAAGEAQVAEAVAAARAAFPAWAALGYAARYAFCEAFKARVEAQKEELAVLIAKETGKALWDARSEAAAVVSKLGFASAAYAERTGEKSTPSAVGTAVVRHRPHGVMAVYGPYNFPAHLPNGHIMPALLAGNVVVLKPSEQVPMVSAWVVQQWEAVGLPAGVLNLVQGERETGIALAKAAVDGVLFTGSSATGKALHAQFAGRPEVMLALEMGGNNALIVHGVADIKAAVHETILSAFVGTGQRCTCARRLILVDWDGADAFLAELVRTAGRLVVGAYDATPAPFMGPLIHLREADRLLAAQEMLLAKGAVPLLAMQSLREGLPFLSAGIVDVTGCCDIPDEEYFGPLLQVYRVPNLEAAVAQANATAFGLSAAIFTDSSVTFQQLSAGIRAGLINWNRQSTGASGAGPFGGIGLSGNHRPAGYYSADYCAYPVASVENAQLALPDALPVGFSFE